MDRKIIIILAIVAIGLVFITSPAFAKENVNVKISTDKWLNGKGVILIKLVDSHGKDIKSSGKIRYTITDSNGNYEWKYKPYNNLIRVKYAPGWYNVKVEFDGDKKYNSAFESQDVNVVSTGSSFDAYNYYDNHNWGLNQKMDDYIEDNYWDEEIYDDASNYDGEGY
ncbi:hypothetical protein [uncultured Methanobrevibacter sp.]|jgi:hypothetical protein|uniref:hypothetical protein n=1 Tax=uncultured Methanobrevibacter sp. TaxID=253161 RepID=UPI0025EE66D0|nr:hypothetical protein [uncultured Methanobrevibacter sp.]